MPSPSFLGVLLLSAFIAYAGYVEGIPSAGTGLRAVRYDLQQQTNFNQLSAAISKNFTFEAWIMVPYPNNGRYKSIVSRYPDPATMEPDYPLVNHTNRYADFNFQIQTQGALNFFMGGSGDPNGSIFKKYGVLINGGFGVRPSRWTHVAFTVNTPYNSRNPDWVYVYVNGKQVNGMKWLPGYQRNDYSETRPIILGHYVNLQNQFFEGFMDEVRFWNYARSPEEIFNNIYTVFSGTEEGLVGYYRHNELSGNILYSEPRGVRKYIGEMTGVTRVGSGVQRLAQYEQVIQGEPELITLKGGDTDNLAIQFSVVQNPSKGKLFTTPDGITKGPEPELNKPLGTGVKALIYQTFGPVGNGLDQFLFTATNTNGVESDPAPVIITITAVPGCDGVNGSGAVYDSCGECGGDDSCIGCDGHRGSKLKYDECGICGGDSSSCVCLPGQGTYRGYTEDELDKIVLLYDIELTINALEELDSEISQTLQKLAVANPADLDLSSAVDTISNYNFECLGQFCKSLDDLAEDLGL